MNRWHNEWQRHFDDERAATATCRKLRRALRGSLKAVVKVSPFVSREEATAKVMGRIGNSSDSDLLSVAAATLDKVTQHSAAFLEQGLPVNVLKNLPLQTDGLTKAKKAQSDARLLRLAAGESIETALGAGDAAIDLLHSIAVSTSDADPNLVSQLRLAKRVGPAKAKGEPPAAEPDPVPAAPAKAA